MKSHHMQTHFENAVKTARQFSAEARSLVEQKKYREAEYVLREGVAAHPDDAILWHRLGKRLRSTYRNDGDALNAFANAYLLAPEDSYIALDLAAFLTKMGHFDAAEQLYAYEFKMDMESTKILFLLGDHYEKRGAYNHDRGQPSGEYFERAVICFGHMLHIDASDEGARRRYVEMREKHGNAFAYGEAGYKALEDRLFSLPEPQKTAAPAPVNP